MMFSGPRSACLAWAWLLFLLAGTSLALSCERLPRFDLTLEPIFSEEEATALEGTIVLDGVFTANESIVQLPLVIASAPTAQYPPEGLVATDAEGPLALASHDLTSGPVGLPTRVWTAERDSTGPVTLRFKAHPMLVDPSTRVGPLFSIRDQTDGVMGSFWALVPAPDFSSPQKYRFSVTWDLPAGMDAAWTWGEGAGPHSFTGAVDRLLLTFFAAGKVSSWHPETSTGEDADFGIFFFDEPPFSVEDVGNFVGPMFQYSTSFWQDTTDEPYRIFIRRNEEQGSGGTAAMRSFMFGYHDAGDITETRLKTLLSHEMTHNWPALRAGTNAESSRYGEGMAEYYSLRLLLRSGVFNMTEFAAEMNSRLEGYYNNPTVALSDEEAMAIAWETREAQRIPYGRGLIHFTNVDAQMRAATEGAGSLDDLALEFQEVCRGLLGNCGNPEWFELLERHLGTEAVDEWNQVSTGSPLVVPQAGSLGPCFDVVQSQADPVAYQWRLKEGADLSAAECQV